MRKKIFISANQREFEKERLLIKNEITNDPILKKYYKINLIEEINKNDDIIKDSYSLGVLNSEIYIGLIGSSYGKIIKDNLSATEYEYHLFSKNNDKSHFFIKNTSKKDSKTKKFIKNISNHSTYEYFNTRQLINAIKNILRDYLYENPEIEIEAFDEEIQNTTKRDIDMDSVKIFLNRCDENFKLLIKYMTIQEMLITIDAGAIDKNTFKLRNAGLLLFGSDIQKFSINNKVKMRRFLSKNKKDVIDEITTTSNIFKLINEFEAFFKKNTLTGYKLHEYRKDYVSSYPYEAVLEALINAVAHNDYNTTTPSIEVNIYTDRIEICNAGRLKENMNLENLESEKYTTNKTICDILKKAGYMHNKGYGIKGIQEILKNNNQGKAIFEQIGDYFKVVIYQNKENYIKEITNTKKTEKLKSLNLSKRQLSILSIMINENKTLSVRDCCEIFDKSSSTIVNDLYWMFDMNIVKREKIGVRYYFSPSDEFKKENIKLYDKNNIKLRWIFLQRKRKIILIAIFVIIIGIIIANDYYQSEYGSHKLIGSNELGTVEKNIYGTGDTNKSIVLITGIHPREKLAIKPEIKAAKQYVKEHDDVKIIHYQVNVTKDPKDYKKGRANGESLVHDFVNPDVNTTDAKCVIISHSHIAGYGEGFYLATPEMDNASVSIAYNIANNSDFRYYPRYGNESYKSTSAVLVSKPIAQAGYPTFVYEIPENITKQDSTDKTKELFDLMVRYAC